jgi:OPT oligopeptide transporter protein
MGDTDTYDRFGQSYDIDSILTPEKHLNVTAFENYSDIYIAPPYLMFNLITFTLSTCIITHTALYHGRTLWNAVRSIDPEDEDIHAKLMKAYPEVPKTWYWGILGIFFLMAVIAVERWPTGVPVYSLIVAVALPAVYVLPAGLIYAVTGQIVSFASDIYAKLTDAFFLSFFLFLPSSLH